jgi:hypothetical protein
MIDCSRLLDLKVIFVESLAVKSIILCHQLELTFLYILKSTRTMKNCRRK